MHLQLLLTKQYERIWDATDQTLDGLTAEDLARRPSRETNSIGWLAWHVARVEDRWTSLLLGRELKGSDHRTVLVDDLWSRGWAIKMGMPENKGSGVGMNPNELDSFSPPTNELLIEYFDAVRSETKIMLGGLRTEFFERPWDSLFGKPMTLLDMFVHITAELNQHVGQMGYLKGLYVAYQGAGGAALPNLGKS